MSFSSYEEHWLLIRAALWSLDYSDRSARKRAWGIGPQPFSFLSLARKRKTEHQLHPLLVLVLMEEAVSTTCPISSYPPGEGSTAGFPRTLAQALDFPVPSLCSLSHGIRAGGLISPRFWYQVYLFIYFISPEGKKVARFLCVCVCAGIFFFFPAKTEMSFSLRISWIHNSALRSRLVAKIIWNIWCVPLI